MSFFEKIIIPLYALMALLMALFTLYAIVLCYHAGTFRDMWVVMDFIRSFFEGDWQFKDFFSLHGGAHRLVFPKLFFLIEYGVFKGSNVFLILSSVVIQCAVLSCFYLMLKREVYLSSRYKLFLMSLAVLFMFNGTQLENFVYTFDMQWFLTCATAVAALACWVIFLTS